MCMNYKMPRSPNRSQIIIRDDVFENSYHFRWVSIRYLLYISFAYASHPLHFDLFSNLQPQQVTIFNFTAMALVIGMTYMCVDLFIKQYTRRLDSDQNLCPVLKGITISFMLQSALHSLTHIRHVGDGVKFLITSLSEKPTWSLCPEHLDGTQCMDMTTLLKNCGRQGTKTRILLNVTSVHINYMRSFKNYDRGILTWRFFVTAVIWILNFLISTIPDSVEVVLKFYKYALYCKVVCSTLTLCFLAIATGRSKEAFMQLMDINVNGSITHAVNDIAIIYGIGMVGVYDYGITSPFTMVDNAVLIFTVYYISFAVIRSMISKMLLLGVTDCVDINVEEVSWHYLFFVLFPLGTEFLYGQKLITIYLYGHLILSLLPYLMLYTSTTCKLLQCEFPSIKTIYIVGLLCLAGLCFSTPVLLINESLHKIMFGIFHGFSATTFFLGGLRMSIIMWMYGVDKFATDIKFWLGFNPTKFWIVLWTILPAILLIAFGYNIYIIIGLNDITIISSAFAWFTISALIVFGFQTRTIVRYLMKNNLSGAFRSNKKYGPLDPQDRKRRRRYDVTSGHMQCFHQCMALDEEIECNHLPLMNTGEGSVPSLTNMYENGPIRTSSMITLADDKSGEKDKLA